MMKTKSVFLNTGEAAALAAVSKVTIINWIKDLGIGKKIAGRWKVDKSKLDKVLSGDIVYGKQGRDKIKG